MDDSWLSSSIHQFDGDALAIHPHHSSNAEWSMHPGVNLSETPVAFEDKLARLEVEQERGHFPLVLVTAGEHTHALLALTHP